MAHILRIVLILGAIVIAVTGYNNNIPALIFGGMLLVLFFFFIHGRINDILTNSNCGFTVFLGVLTVLFAIAGVYVSGRPLEPFTFSIEDTYKARNMLFFVSFFFAAQIPCRLYAGYSEKKRAGLKVAAKNNSSKFGTEKKSSITEIHYFDSKGNRCEKEYAVKAEILEYDENGKLVNRVIGHVTPTAKKPETVDDITVKTRKDTTADIAANSQKESTLGLWRCPFCGRQNKQRFCVGCGKKKPDSLGQPANEQDCMKSDEPPHRNETNANDEPEAQKNTADTKPKLVIKRRSSGELLATDKPVTVIGSDRKSDFYINNKEVDDINAIILYKNNKWCVANDLSYKPVVVNGEKVQPGERRVLRRGDVVKIANVETLDVTECRDGEEDSDREKSQQNTTTKSNNTENKQPEETKKPVNNPFSLRNVSAKMADYMAKGQFSSAKMLGDTVISSVMQQKSEKIDGHTLQLTPLEWAMHAALLGHADEKPDAEDDYTSFFLAYARALQNTKIMDGNKERFMHTESGPYLGIAAELSPENADVWHLLANAASAEGDYETFLECMKRSLMFAYEKTGPCSLADAYEELGVYYATRGDNLELASALYEAVRACGGESLALPFLLEKKDASANTRDYKAILQQHRIQIGISPLVSAASQFLSDGNYAEMLDDRTKRIIKENSAPLP